MVFFLNVSLLCLFKLGVMNIFHTSLSLFFFSFLRPRGICRSLKLNGLRLLCHRGFSLAFPLLMSLFMLPLKYFLLQKLSLRVPVADTLVNVIVVIISQYLSVSNHNVWCFKIIPC